MSPEASWTPDWKALDGYRFQDLCLDLLSFEGYEVQDQGIGPDGGVDAILIQKFRLPDDTAKQIRWAAQFKFKMDPGATVKPRELGNVENILGKFQAEGFFLVTNGRVTSKAVSELRGTLINRHPSYFLSVWTGRHLEERLCARRELACRYFILPEIAARPSTICEITIDLAFEDFSDRQERLLQHALASFLEIPVTSIKIKKKLKGSKKIFVEMPQASAQLLQEAFEGDYLALDTLGFEPTILAVRELGLSTTMDITTSELLTFSRSMPAPSILGSLALAEEREAEYRKRFGELYRRYHRYVLAYLNRFGHSHEEALDLAQDTFLRIYLLGMNQYRGGSDWVFIKTMARRVATNSFRKRAAQKRPDGERVSLELEELYPLPDSLLMASPETELIEREEQERRRRWLRQAINGLSDRLQQSVRLYLGGLGYHKIGDSLNIDVFAAKMQIRDAVRVLRRLAEKASTYDNDNQED